MKLTLHGENVATLDIIVNEDGEQLKELLKKRGYILQDGKETTSYMNVPHDVKLELPNGFRISDANEVASFTTFWYDELNKIGILEPVGTIPKYRKMGLGKAVIYEAIKRVKDKGVERIFSMGFSLAYSKEIWKKRISLFNAD